MVLDRIEGGRITVDQYFDVRCGSEKYFEYIGREAYRALPRLLYNNDIERFMAFFETVNEECKHNLVGGEQFQDVEGRGDRLL